jgi:hypothetical protein
MSNPHATKSPASNDDVQAENPSAETAASQLAKRRMAASLVDDEDRLASVGLDDVDTQAETPEEESNATGGALPQSDDGDNDNDNDDARERDLPDHFRRDPADDKM